MKSFYHLLVNNLIAGITNFTVWFAIIFYVYLQTHSVFATSLMSGIFLVTTATTGIWFGSLVDHHKKKNVMLVSSFLTLFLFCIGLGIYLTVDPTVFTHIDSVWLWIFVPVLLFGVIIGGIRNIALPTLVTVMIPEGERDKANGLVGTTSGIAFLITSVISGVLVGHSGMLLVLILAIIVTLVSIMHLWWVPINEKGIAHVEGTPHDPGKGVDLRGTLKAIGSVPGLFALILFAMFNNFLGGVFMSLMDAYGLSMVSVEIWGFLWGGISTAFIFGGLIIAKFGLGKNPLRSLFRANAFIWIICCLFTIQPSIILLAIGAFLYLCVVPFIEASEHTIMQKVVAPERQGRVFGFAQSVEQSASPLTAFAIGPIAQYLIIPFMTDGYGAATIGPWFGTGPARGIALVFTIAGILGLTLTLFAWNSKYYKQLSREYAKK